MSQRDKNGKWWAYAQYGESIKYAKVDSLIKILQKAQNAQERGEWRDITLETQEYDTDSYTIVLMGYRPESERERATREKVEEQQDTMMRAQYEQLKKKFEGK